MKQYKPSMFVLGKNIVYALCGGFVAGLIAEWLLPSFLALLIAIAVAGAVAYLTLYTNNISVNLDDKTISFFRFGKLIKQYPLEGTGFKAKITTTSDSAGTDADCDLTVIPAEGEEETIDCSMLGDDTFWELIKDLGLTDKAPQKIKTEKKDKQD
ncbi:hypothetical protein Dip518_001489 [Parelusimicrobium proximum]|uniref:hypothetical protein n=1 Tax=Parelusimicrobium proximum TaxID=3228953 RepID=UPI003D1687E4